MAKKSSKPSKSPKQLKSSSRRKSPSANSPEKSSSFSTVVLGLLLCISLLANICLFKKLPTHEEEKRLEAFETIADNLIEEQVMYSEDARASRTARLTDIGLSDDDDLYLDFTMTNFENHIPVSTQDGRLHFQCNKENNYVIIDNPGCALAYWYDEIKETPEDFRETYQSYLNDLEASVALCNETMKEDESGNVEYSPECEEKRNELNEKYTDFFEEIK